MKRNEAPTGHIWDEFPESDYSTPEDAEWIEITRELSDYCLGCIPPIKWKDNAFAVGEAAAHTKQGVPVYTMVVDVVGRCFMADRAVTSFDPAEYTQEIKQQFGIR